MGEDWVLDRTGLVFYCWKQETLCWWVTGNHIQNWDWRVSPISAEDSEPPPYVPEDDPRLSEEGQTLANLGPLPTTYPPQFFSVFMLSSVKLHHSLPVLSVTSLILFSLGTFWQVAYVTEWEDTVTLLLWGQLTEKVGTLQSHPAPTFVWSWCDSASKSCSLLQSFSCETLKNSLTLLKGEQVPRSAFFGWQGSQGA